VKLRFRFDPGFGVRGCDARDERLAGDAGRGYAGDESTLLRDEARES
jgi:hypothetical protein